MTNVAVDPERQREKIGTRLLHETPEAKDVTDSNHEVGTITIHRNNIEGWLVTHTTLNPAVGNPVAVRPDVPLFRHARRSHWTIVDWASPDAAARPLNPAWESS